MPNPNVIFKIFQFNMAESLPDDLKRKVAALNLFGLVSVTLFTVYAIIGLLTEADVIVIASLAALLLTLLSILFLNRRGKVTLSAYTLILSYMVVGLGMAYTGVSDQFSLLNSYFLPLFAVFMLSSNRALLVSSLYLGLVSALLFFPLFDRVIAFSLSFKITFFVSYILVFLTSWFVEYFWISVQSDLEKQVLVERNATKRKDEFIASLSHQIRTPLNNIMVIANLVDSLAEDEKMKDLIDTIHASTNNLVNVVNSMVEVANVDVTERDSFIINFNLSQTVANTIKLFAHQYSSNIQFNLKIDEIIPSSLGGEPVKIKQIFLNLIESLIKAKSNNKILIDIVVKKLSESPERVELLFELRSNSPIFIPTGDGRNQLITNDMVGNAIGSQVLVDVLDLRITQRLIESNGGRLSINLHSETSVFSFPYSFYKVVDINALTREELDGQSMQNNLSTSPNSLMRKVDLADANVLLVEDNLINQKIVILSLKKLVKNIEIANNGKEALDKFGTSRFDIILMDIQMPIMNGIVTTRKIREIESSTNTHTPIIAITANALQGDREECISAGMDEYLSKPFQIEVLIQKMKKLLQGS
ncbi:CheY chemotaxis protein or a CheY-like REC (receiver) domain [Williamwhitmania taraxaci]|uniref:histidine kinase n=2 Tax=Williamwhitmania taraxaci TaxID=1640674 RepID=A0A1G6HCI2_9BACT|nr:CheY chemotaxis protein or a CheY-like REC (receiver) domain [Williamwhitmania taraxaci]